MGIKDYYVAALKGRILQLAPEAVIIDITHQIRSFRVSEAAYHIRAIVDDFPEGTVHVIGVDSEPLINFSDPNDSILPLIMKYKGQFFVGADNGFFNLLLEGEEAEGFWQLEDALSQPHLMKFPEKNLLIPAACKLLNGIPLEEFCTPTTNIHKAIEVAPVITENTLRGTVIHIDYYGNIISNIKQKHFDHFGAKTPFTIYFRDKQYYIDQISTGYNDVSHGEKIAFFNDNGLLEIAINKGTIENGGGANQLLGIKLNDIIRVEFTPRGSRQTIESLF